MDGQLQTRSRLGWWLAFVAMTLLAVAQFMSGGSPLAGFFMALSAAALLPLLHDIVDLPAVARAGAAVVLFLAGFVFAVAATRDGMSECIQSKRQYFRQIGSYPVLSDGRDADTVAREQCADPAHRDWVRSQR